MAVEKPAINTYYDGEETNQNWNISFCVFSRRCTYLLLGCPFSFLCIFSSHPFYAPISPPWARVCVRICPRDWRSLSSFIVFHCNSQKQATGTEPSKLGSGKLSKGNKCSKRIAGENSLVASFSQLDFGGSAAAANCKLKPLSFISSSSPAQILPLGCWEEKRMKWKNKVIDKIHRSIVSISRR